MFALLVLLGCPGAAPPSVPEIEVPTAPELPEASAPSEASPTPPDQAEPAEHVAEDEADPAPADRADAGDAVDQPEEGRSSPPPSPAVLGASCLEGADCASGVCEGEGCGADTPGRCVAETRRCTRDLKPYCGCDDETFTASGSCPGRRYRATGPCSGDVGPVRR